MRRPVLGTPSADPANDLAPAQHDGTERHGAFQRRHAWSAGPPQKTAARSGRAAAQTWVGLRAAWTLW